MEVTKMIKIHPQPVLDETIDHDMGGSHETNGTY